MRAAFATRARPLRGSPRGDPGRRPGNTSPSDGLPTRRRRVVRMATAGAGRGARCSRLAFISLAGMRHAREARSNCSHFARWRLPRLTPSSSNSAASSCTSRSCSDSTAAHQRRISSGRRYRSREASSLRRTPRQGFGMSRPTVRPPPPVDRGEEGDGAVRGDGAAVLRDCRVEPRNLGPGDVQELPIRPRRKVALVPPNVGCYALSPR